MSYPHLFSPLSIGRVTVPNRISFSAHLTNLADDGLVTDRLIAYLAERARGGTGLIITEEQSVHPTDRAYEHLIEAFLPEVIPGYKKLTRAVHEFDTRIFAQLNHNGQQCSGSLSRLPVWAPSAVPDVLFREVPKVMEIEDIQEVIAYFCRSAVHVREGGYDGVELQFGHASLVRQFMSPLTNYRGDEYGGDDERRLRFALELVAAVRQAVGDDFTLGVRLCADELIPGGLTLDDAKRIAARLEATGHVDFFNLTLSTFYNLYLVGGTMHLPLGYTVPLAAGVKSAVTLPVFATGRINDPALAERVLADGQADMIGVVRGQIADPEFANKAKEGRADEIRACIACNQNCYGRVGLNKPIGCVQNPGAGSEATEGERHLVPTLRPQAGHGRGRRPGGHVGGEGRDPARPRRDSLRRRARVGRAGAVGHEGRRPRRVRRHRAQRARGAREAASAGGDRPRGDRRRGAGRRRPTRSSSRRGRGPRPARWAAPTGRTCSTCGRRSTARSTWASECS